MSKKTYAKMFKNFFLVFLILWIVIIFGGIKLYSTLRAGEALGISVGSTWSKCDANDYRSNLHSPVYVPPLESVSKLLSNNLVGDNIIPNADFQQLSGDGQLIFYPNNPSVSGLKKSIETEPGNKKYLRVERTKQKLEVPGAWISDTLPIKNSPYYYTFEYRGDAKSNIVIEKIDQNGKSTYESLHNLDASRDWKTVEGSIENYSGNAKAIRISVVTRSVGTLDYRELKLIELQRKLLSEPMISVSYDDGWKNVYESTFPIMQDLGIASTQFINPLSAKEERNNYMNFNEIEVMARAGHEIATHSLSHCVQTTLDDKQQQYDAKKSEQIMNDNGYPSGTGFAYPFGVYNEGTQKNRVNYHNYIRTSQNGYNDYYYDRSRLLSKTIESTTTHEDVKAWVNEAKNNNLWLILVYHNIEQSGEFSIKADRIQKDLQMIKESGVKTYTIQQALNILDN